MVEHATENRGVPSSTLGLGTTSPKRTRRPHLALTSLLVLGMALSVLVLACDGDSSGPFVAEATLAPGDSLSPKRTNVSATFVGVEGDSRCATDVVCVRAGEATVRLEVKVGSKQYPLAVVVPRESSAGGQAGDVEVTVLELRPLPVSTNPIAAEDYRVKIRLQR